MNLVDFNIPEIEIIFNSLYENPSNDLLMQDLVGIRLADGTFIDVGWYPQFDPSGYYKVSHRSAAWDEELQTVKTRSVLGVIEEVRQIAERIVEVRVWPTSCSSEVRSRADYPSGGDGFTRTYATTA